MRACPKIFTNTLHLDLTCRFRFLVLLSSPPSGVRGGTGPAAGARCPSAQLGAPTTAGVRAPPTFCWIRPWRRRPTYVYIYGICLMGIHFMPHGNTAAVDLHFVFSRKPGNEGWNLATLETFDFVFFCFVLLLVCFKALFVRLLESHTGLYACGVNSRVRCVVLARKD